ncbi:eotaxin isoform X6 [Oreochromis niloticus]|uniref:eotaxin isoform X5 n=1 Tax=Oreochromis niloticus TaxID=8128 RepID=UPI000DF2F7EB|nr:eotaxin-like isoform X5 [Oreochromis niloticus]XP_025760127.1 eotaxin-like isoform X6 [Oreochromis niloticus]
MSLKILSITLLLLFVCVCCHSSKGTRRRHPGRIPPCCPAVTKGNKRGDVVGETYREQAATPPCVKAIIFNTKDGKQLCADPDAQWVKDLTAKMRKV